MTKASPHLDELIALAGALRLAVVVVDGCDCIEAAAPRAEELLGLVPGSAAGRPLAGLCVEPQSAQRLLRRFRRVGSLLPGALGIADSTGERLVRCEGVRMPGATGRAPAVVLLFRTDPPEGFTILQEKLDALAKEIRLRRQIESEYRKLLLREKRARRAAEEADRMKDEFLAIVSHELRTPLNAVLSWAEILRMDAPEGHTADGLERIERNARAQAELIDDLLDTSRIVSNNIGLEPREIALSAVLNEVVEVVRPEASEKGIRVEVGGDLEPTAELDPARIRQVLRNLLDNAIKFSQQDGRVEVTVAVDEHRVSFRIADEGRGLKAEELEYIFDRFRQVDQHSRRKHGGLGLGLAIAKQLVELHGGSIRAESAGLDQGCAFSFELPRRAIAPTTIDTRSTNTAPPDAGFLRDVRVLVVEDNDDARDALVRFLERQGAEPIGFASVPAALAELRRELPALVLTDLQMPGEDGYDLLESIRADERLAPLPVLALTAHARPEDRKRALAAGFDAYLAKPVPPSELLRALGELCVAAPDPSANPTGSDVAG